MKQWIKKNPKKTIVATTVVVVVLILIGFEIYLASATDTRDRADARYIRLREHIPLSVIRDKTLPQGSLMRVDANGFIEPSIVHEDPDLQIVFLGGSTTECLIVEEEKRFPYLVGRILERETGLKVNAVNCGCRGNTTAHSINSLFNKIVPLKPDHVVVMHNINDLALLAYMGTYWNDHFTRSLIIRPDQGMLETIKLFWANTFPNLYLFLKRHGVLDLEAMIHRNQEDEWKAYRTLNTQTDPAAIKKMFADNLRAIIALCRNFGINPILMTQPNNGDTLDSVINGIKIQEMHAQFNAIIRQIARQENVFLIDLAQDMTKTDYFLDFVHLNNYGSSTAAKAISNKLLPHLKAEKDRSEN